MTVFVCVQVVLATPRHAREYSEMVVEDGSAILKDMVLDPSQENIYVMTSTNVSSACVCVEGGGAAWERGYM